MDEITEDKMKQTLLMVFGGQSTEHEISCRSVINVINNIDTERYSLLMVGITKEGKWLLVPETGMIADGSWYNSEIRAMLLPDAEKKSLLLEMPDGRMEYRRIDAAFPVLHGKNGEDGTIQGLFELAGIPYVGCGVLSSAVSMDKLFTKIICEKPLKAINVRQAAFVSVAGKEMQDLDRAVKKIEAVLDYPVFVKPSNAGSSCGVSKASDEKELRESLIKAYAVDRKILVEETIVGREVECAVIRDADGVIHTSGVGEILAAADFYDYDAKYNNPQSETDTHPDISETDRELIRKAAGIVFDAVDGYSLSRVDFFLTADGPVFNELNTLPGFTAISMFPMLWEAAGMDKKELMQKLIDTAFVRNM